MVESDFNKDKQIKYWLESSDEDFETAITLFENKKYSWSLFVGHLVIEKLLKAHIVNQTGKLAPFIHDLTRLAEITNINFSEEYLDWLDTVTTFNIRARYESYKREFYYKCTEGYTTDWIKKITELRQWIKQKQLQ